MGLHAKTLPDYIYLAKRRKHYILVTWFLVSLVALLIALSMPKMYRSTATMLIEAPLQTKLFESTVSEFADERVQSLYQRVLATNNVIALIDKNQLYENLKNEYPKQSLVDLFKSNTEVNLAVTSILPKANSGLAEFAFDISFLDSDAEVAQRVATNLAMLFIEQNDKARTQRATKAAEFLFEESEKLSKDLQEIENKIAVFKEQNNFSLPDQSQNTLAIIDRLENELRDTESQIRSTKDRITFLEAELANAPEPVFDEKATGKENSLEALRAQYVKLLSIYSTSHPSVARLKREIQMLDPSFEGRPEQEDVLKQLTKSKNELKALEKSYSIDHPEIIKLKTQIDRLQEQLKSVSAKNEAAHGTKKHTNNPAYLGLEAQFRTSQTDLHSLYQKLEHLKAKLERTQNVMTLAPQVEKGYNDLIRERDNTKNKYIQVKEKLLDAKLYQTQEQHQQGQTLTIIEEPVVPLQAEKAIRRKVAVGGFFLGLFAGIGLALLVEFLDPKLTGYRAIAEVTGLMPLVVIPYIETTSEDDEKIAKLNSQKKIWLLSFIAFVLISVLVYYFFYYLPS
jgi:polysaccharide biosynthesis transport protein